MTDKEVHRIICPCCGEVIPVRVDLVNNYIDEGYITIDGSYVLDKPFPIIEIGMSLNIEALADKIDTLLPEYFESQKRIRGSSDEDLENEKL